MSPNEIQRFYKQLEEDADFAKAYQKLTENQQERAIMRFAREHGFNFTRAQLQYALQNPTKELFIETNNIENIEPIIEPEMILSVNSLERAFIWLSGVSPKILATCPECEQKKHAALGATILIPALFSTVTSSFLLSTLQNFNTLTIIAVALLWMLIVLLMDRALLATYRKSFSFWVTVRQFSLRFLIALLIAFTVAHPVILLLFSGTINEEYDKTKLNRHNQLTAQYQKQSDALNQQIKEQQALLKTNSSFEPPICNNKNQAVLTATDELAQLEAKKLQAQENIKVFRKNAEDERNGVSKEGLTGHKGCAKDSECRAWIHKANEAQEQVNVLERDIARIKAVIADQLAEQQQSLAKQCASERQSWSKQMLVQNELAQKKISALLNQSNELDKYYSLDNKHLNALKPDILRQTKILHSIMGFNNVEQIGNLLLFLAFMLLFLLIDMLAVLLKLTSSGIYESKVDIEEYHNNLLNFVSKRQQSIIAHAKLIATENKTIETISNANLKIELANGLEKLILLLSEADNERQQHFFNVSTSHKKLTVFQKIRGAIGKIW